MACPKSRCSGYEPTALEAEPFPGRPPGLFAAARRASEVFVAAHVIGYGVVTHARRHHRPLLPATPGAASRTSCGHECERARG